MIQSRWGKVPSPCVFFFPLHLLLSKWQVVEGGWGRSAHMASQWQREGIFPSHINFCVLLWLLDHWNSVLWLPGYESACWHQIKTSVWQVLLLGSVSYDCPCPTNPSLVITDAVYIPNTSLQFPVDPQTAEGCHIPMTSLLPHPPTRTIIYFPQLSVE